MALSDYEIVGTIGRESDGLLLAWREQPVEARGLYALRRVEPRLLAVPDFAERLLREAAVGGRVEHPALVRVHEVLLDEEFGAVVLDYVDGHSLEEVLDRRAAARRGVPREVALELVAHLLEAVDDIHDLELDGEPCYHGRIVPAKVMLTADGGLKLVGFGVAAPRAERRSPERLGPAADQFAIGLLLLDLLLGRRVSWEESLQPSRGRWSRTLDEALREVPMSDPCLPVLLRLLAQLPGDRFETCAEAADAVRRLRRGYPDSPALAGFAADEVAAIREDDCNATELELDDDADEDDPSSEWLEDLPGAGHDVDYVVTIQEGPLLNASTVPFAEGFTPRASWFHASRETPILTAVPPTRQQRAVLAAQDTAGYTSNPFLEASRTPVYSPAPSLGMAPSAETAGTIPFAHTYSDPESKTRSVPGWVLASETSPIPSKPRLPSVEFEVSLPGKKVRRRRKRARAGGVRGFFASLLGRSRTD